MTGQGQDKWWLGKAEEMHAFPEETVQGRI